MYMFNITIMSVKYTTAVASIFASSLDHILSIYKDTY
jgi:hypothetical protein